MMPDIMALDAIVLHVLSYVITLLHIIVLHMLSCVITQMHDITLLHVIVLQIMKVGVRYGILLGIFKVI